MVFVAKFAVLCGLVSITFKVLVLSMTKREAFKARCGALHSLQAVASKTTKLGNWMIWMVHRAHLDDPTLVKFDTWQSL